MDLKIFCDGGARGNPGPAAWAFIVYDDKNQILAQKNEKMGEATNNVAEYTAVIKTLEWLKDYMGHTKAQEKDKRQIRFYLDSQLVTSQLNGLYKVKNPRMRELIVKVREGEWEVGGNILYEYIPREKNKMADSLVNEALDTS